MPKASSRPSLATSSSDFALPQSSSTTTTDEVTPLLPRFRRPSILSPKASYLSEPRSSSPLAASFQPSPRRRPRHHAIAEGSESDKERMLTDSSASNSSQNPTPPEYIEDNDKDTRITTALPQTPPRKLSSSTMDTQDLPLRSISRRLSFPVSLLSSHTAVA